MADKAGDYAEKFINKETGVSYVLLNANVRLNLLVGQNF
jgi:hypothetical protein